MVSSFAAREREWVERKMGFIVSKDRLPIGKCLPGGGAIWSEGGYESRRVSGG